MPQASHQHTFANGLTLLAERMTHVRSAALNFLVPAGCAYDPPAERGLASVLADLITRGAGERDSRALTLALDNLGLDRDDPLSARLADPLHPSRVSSTPSRVVVPAPCSSPTSRSRPIAAPIGSRGAVSRTTGPIGPPRSALSFLMLASIAASSNEDAGKNALGG